jgi:hypothetical protein
MKLTADDVQTVVFRGIGHWLAEQAPDEMVADPRSHPHAWRSDYDNVVTRRGATRPAHRRCLI